MAITIKPKSDEVKKSASIINDNASDSQENAIDPAIESIKKQLAEAELREKTEREKRITAENEVKEANTKVASSQNNEIKAHEIALGNAIEVATGNISHIKRELKEAMEGGDLEKQVDLQEKLSDARWKYNNAEQSKKQFDTWKEQQEATAKQPKQEQKPQYTASEQAWIDAHPLFETDDDYYGVVAGADASARRKGIKPDTKAYYEYVETALKRSGFEQDDTVVADNGRDTTGAMQQTDEDEQEEVVTKKPKLVVPSAPASYSAPTSGNNTRSKTQFKLTPEMRDMAHRMFGPSSSHKLTERDAEQKYAAHQLDIRERRANGEKI